MPPLKPIKRRDLIYYLKQLGFDGPYSGKRHQFMLKDNLRITIPNPHQGDISANFLAKILRSAKVDISDWENLYFFDCYVKIILWSQKAGFFPKSGVEIPRLSQKPAFLDFGFSRGESETGFLPKSG